MASVYEVMHMQLRLVCLNPVDAMHTLLRLTHAFGGAFLTEAPLGMWVRKPTGPNLAQWQSGPVGGVRTQELFKGNPWHCALSSGLVLAPKRRGNAEVLRTLWSPRPHRNPRRLCTLAIQ